MDGEKGQKTVLVREEESFFSAVTQHDGYSMGFKCSYVQIIKLKQDTRGLRIDRIA